MKRISMLITVALLLALGASIVHAQSGYDLFQKALVKERAVGDVEEAIRLYRRVVNEFGSNHALAAKAQLRLGLLYDRLGRKTDAQRAFQSVVSNYSDQADMVRQARARIVVASNGRAPAGTKNTNGHPATGLTERLVWTVVNGDPAEWWLHESPIGAVSQDGRYLAYVDYSAPRSSTWGSSSLGGLAVRDLLNGTNQRLTKTESRYSVEESAFSPDGRQIAFNADDNTDDNKGEQLRMIAVDGSGERTVYSQSRFVRMPPRGWSMDGKSILVTLAYSNTGIEKIAWISTVDGSERVVKTLQRKPGYYYARGLGPIALSPDGKYIAYSRPAAPEDPSLRVFVMAADGSQDTPLVESRWNDYVLGWAPDGKGVLFASNRTGTYSALLQPVANGKPVGNVVLVKRDIGRVSPMGITGNGALYYTAGSDLRPWSELFTVTINPETGKLVGRPSLLTPPNSRIQTWPAWSPDGRMVAYWSVFPDPDRPWILARDTYTLYIHDVEKGSDRELKSDVDFRGGRMGWWPDSRALLLSGKSKQGHAGIYRVEVGSGRSGLMKEFDPEVYRAIHLSSPDGKTIFYGLDSGISRFDVASGEEKILYRPPQGSRLPGTIQLSPDGQWIAFQLRSGESVSFFVMPSSGGEPRKVHSAAGPTVRNALAWSGDGRYLLFSSRTSSSERYDLWRVPVEGGAPQKLETGLDAIQPNVSPDGRRLIFERNSNQQEVWAMENFLSPTKSKEQLRPVVRRKR